MQQERQWEALPSLALANVFCRTSIKDRSHSIPFVCESWARAARHPHCWSSMIAENYRNSAADHAFVMDPSPDVVSFVDPYDGWRSPDPHRGVENFQRLIGRAVGGAAADAAITSIYFFPFLTSVGGTPNDDAILRVIAERCLKLKHLSFHGSHNASEKAILEVIRSCRKLELVDFSDSPYFNRSILGELSSCCPKIRGIRTNGSLELSFSDVLSTSFPFLRILNISNSTLVDKDLLTVVAGCRGLCYLDITGCQGLIYYMQIIKVASARIAKILYD